MVRRRGLGWLLVICALALGACSGAQTDEDEDPVVTEDPLEAANARGLETARQAMREYAQWRKFNAQSWVSSDHQGALVDVHGNRITVSFYGTNNPENEAPAGSVLVLHSWITSQKDASGPSWVMVKMDEGYDPEHDNWFYAKMNLNGDVLFYGNSEEAQVRDACLQCHGGAPMDHLFGVPPAGRAAR